jgi:hypothetical protein
MRDLLLTVCVFAGITLMASDGPLFPYINLAGIGVVFLSWVTLWRPA